MTNAKRKQSLYMPSGMADEITETARRLDRSMSWVVQLAWKTALDRIRSIPSAYEPSPPTSEPL